MMVALAGRGVAPGGVCNLRAARTATIRRGRRVERIEAEQLDAVGAAPILKQYLRENALVRPQVAAGVDDPVSAFEATADRYPVFLIRPVLAYHRVARRTEPVVCLHMGTGLVWGTVRMAAVTGVLALVLVGAGCAASEVPRESPAAVTPSSTAAEAEVKLVDVGNGRSVSATCWGSGSPAVIFLHGLIMQGDSDGWAHSPELQQRIAPETTYCEYERVNVGASSKVDGPFAVTDTVADLKGLIQGLGLASPVVLVGGSFGGLVAYTYAGTHPADVAGAVLLDPTLQSEDEIEKSLLPESMWLPYEAWEDTREQIDVLGAYPVAREALAGIPSVPGTIFVTESLEAPDPASAEAFRAGIRQMQADLIAHFDPSATITVDAPHAMLPIVPDEIAAAVIGMVDAAG